MTNIEFESDKKIGPLGESKFSSWCAEAELTSNRSLEEDRTGWDHLVEFPYIKTDLPRDKQISPIECRVQVKSTQRRDRKWSIKASVLKRLVDYSYPSFFLFLEFTPGPEPAVENAFLVHVDKRLIERTLKAIRKNDTKKSPNALYDLKISVSYNKEHSLTANTGGAFRDAVLSYVKDGDIVKYQKGKRNLVDTIGYEGRRFKFKFEASPEEMEKHLLARAIGQKGEPFVVRNPVVFDDRFNLENGSVEIKRAEEASVTIDVNVVDSCQIRIKENSFSPSINFEGELLSLVDVYNVEKNNIFIRTKLFSLEINNIDSNGQIDAKCHFSLDKEVPLDEIINIFRLFEKGNKGKDLIFEVELMKEKRVINLLLGIKSDFQYPRGFVDRLISLKKMFSLDSGFITNVDDVLQKSNDITLLVDTLQNNFERFRISFSENVEEVPEKIATPFTTGIEIGNATVGAITLLHGTHLEGNNYQVTEVQVLRPLVFNGHRPSTEKISDLERQEVKKIEIDRE